jgi:hypothetical protein
LERAMRELSGESSDGREDESELAAASRATATAQVLATEMGLAAPFERTHDFDGNERSLDKDYIGMLRTVLPPEDFMQVMNAAAASETHEPLASVLSKLHGRPKEDWRPWTLQEAGAFAFRPVVSTALASATPKSSMMASETALVSRSGASMPKSPESFFQALTLAALPLPDAAVSEQRLHFLPIVVLSCTPGCVVSLTAGGCKLSSSRHSRRTRELVCCGNERTSAVCQSS